jgi:hypothetical protein
MIIDSSTQTSSNVVTVCQSRDSCELEYAVREDPGKKLDLKKSDTVPSVYHENLVKAVVIAQMKRYFWGDSSCSVVHDG